jgi:hypothetical protein
MNAAFTSYDESAGPGSGVTGGHERLCGTTGTTGTAARRARPSACAAEAPRCRFGGRYRDR